MNELNNLLAQAEVDAVENAQKLIEAQADVEAYILKLEGEKADSAAVYSQKYFAALGEIEKLQIEEIKYKAMRALVNQGAVIAREVIYMEIEDNNEEIAKNEAIIAHLKEHQSWTPEQAEAAPAAAREELEQAYTAYQDAVEFENTLEQTETEVWNKSADFTYGWPNSFVNDLKALVPGVTKSGFDTEYGWFEQTGYYDEEGEFVPLYNREQVGSVSERYPDVEVYAFGDFTVVHHPAILPATIYYDNIDELLASYTEAVAAGAAEAVADFGDELEDRSEILEALIDANEERLALHQKYVDARKETVEKAEKKFLNDLAAKESAEAAAAAAWDNFQEYWLVHYDASRQLVYDLYDTKTAYAVKKKVSDEKQIALMSGTIGYLAANRDKAEQFIAANGAPEVVEAYDEVKNSPVEKVSKSLPIEETGNGDILFREMYTGRWFHSNVDAVEQAIVRFKDRFDNGNTLCMNDFYQELGLLGTTHGCTIGWNPDLSSTRLLTINVRETYYVDKFGEVHHYHMIEFGPSDYPYNYYRY